MGLFKKQIGVVFLKEESDAQNFIDKMDELYQKAQGELKREIKQQRDLAWYGMKGEDNVAFELKNSGMDMYVLRDVYLESGEMSAQIDYVIVTRKRTYVVECKNLIGNIEIDNAGNFIRTYELSGKKIREGIYSPITQNQRHLQIMKEVRKASKANFLTKALFEKNFEENYRSVVVLANPKTVLNARYAKKEIKDQVIRADQLSTFIKEMDAKYKDSIMSTEQMQELANFFLKQNQPNKSDYVKKYRELVEEVGQAVDRAATCGTDDLKGQKKTVNKSVEEIRVQLQAFRTEQSRKEKVKPYYIYNNEQMERLLEQKPRNKDELLKIQGFGPAKVQKYGDAILSILALPLKGDRDEEGVRGRTK